MGKSISEEELFFINTFIKHNRRERLCFELASSQKRSSCIWRFAHMARDYLQISKLISVHCINGKLMTNTDNLLVKHQKDNVYVVYFDADMDRKTLNFICAIDTYFRKGPYIMIGCNRKFVLIETEPQCEEHEIIYMHI